jgi:pantothenate synthetase
MADWLIVLGLHDVHNLVVVNQLTETFEVTIEVLIPLKIVRSVDIADQDQSAGIEIMRPLSR